MVNYGRVVMMGGTLQGLDDYLPNLQLLGGTVILSPTYQTNGVIVRLDLKGATLGGISNRVVGVLNGTDGGISCTLEVAANGVVNLDGTGVYGAMAVRTNGTFNWLGGRFQQGSSLRVERGGLLNLLGGGQKDLGGAMLNYGRVVMMGGTFYVMNDNGNWKGSVVNLGIWEMQGDVTLAQYWSYDYGSFGNGGILRKTAGTGNTIINLPFYNPYGAVEVWTGTLRFDHGQQLDGLFTVDAGAVIQLNSGTFTYRPPGRFTGDGQYQLYIAS